jgi:hypothetical protein
MAVHRTPELKFSFEYQHIEISLRNIEEATWLGRLEYGQIGLQHSIIDDLLLIREGPICGEGAGDIGG